MRSLSLKIFLWFWLAVLVGSIAFLSVALWFPSQTILGRAADYFAFNLTTTGKMGIDLYEQEGSAAMEDFLGSIETISAFKLHIVTEQGTPLTGGPPSPAVLALAWRAIAEEDIQTRDWSTHPLIAQHITSDSGRHYAIVLELPAGLVHLLKQMASAFAFRFAAALLASGVVCFLMVRYLTSPIRKLQAAVRKFSMGDLSVRVAGKLGSRKDEIADLGRDFDKMAARIETLMHAHELLLRDAAHELRSPLTRLNVALEIARKHGNAPMEGYLNRIATEAEKLSRLISQVLLLSRLENIDVELRLESVCLEKLIDRIVQDANFEGQDRNATISFRIEQPVTFKADSRLLHSAIENVVRNALRFSPSGSEVDIVQSTQKTDARSTAVVTISDMGPGVPRETLSELFTPFFRVAGKQERSSDGAGIGLAIAKRAVSLHRGAIRAVNRSAGGLSVEISLPIEESALSGPN